MKKELTTEKVLVAYRILGPAKYDKMSDEDKVKVWKIARQMKPIATQFEEESKDASEKLKPGDDFVERLQKAQEYERKVKEGDTDGKLPMAPKEYQEFMKEFQKFQGLVDKAIREFAKKMVSLDFEPLTEEAFGKLMASNSWTSDQTIELGDILCE